MIFLDTSFHYPLFNVEDDDHGRVREVFEARRGQPLTEFPSSHPRQVGRDRFSVTGLQILIADPCRAL